MPSDRRGEQPPAGTNELTGLADRVGWLTHLAHVAEGAGDGSLAAVALVDLDGFAQVNEALGFAAGDAILQAVGELLATLSEPGGITAHLGGDRFALAIPAYDLQGVMSLGRAIQCLLSGPFIVAEQPMYVTASVAVAAIEQPTPVETMVGALEEALARVKRRGGADVELVARTTGRAVADRMLLVSRLHQAVANDEFTLHYQPVVDLVNGRVVAAEALIRWPTRSGVLGPAEFLDVAEASTLIVPLGGWAVRAACRQAAAWRQLAGHPIRVAVNLSGRQLHDPGLPAQVSAALRAAEVDADQLCLEITESVLMDELADAQDTMWRLRDLGVRLSVDDFGTGHSSLARLRTLPVDELKIDRSFVAGVDRHSSDVALVEAMLQLAATLGMDTIAEGVERPAQAAELAALGCPLAQGFLWSAPIDTDAFQPLLAHPQAPPRPTVTPPTLIRLPDAGADTPTAGAVAEAVDDALAYLVHELRTPLMLQRWVIDDLSEQLRPAEAAVAQDRLADLNRQIDASEHLLATLDDLRRLHTDDLALTPTRMDLAAFVRDTVEDYARLHPDRRIDVNAPVSLPVDGDPHRLGQLITNLLSNAVRFSPTAAPVHVRLDTTADGHARLSVVDHGPGVSSHHEDRIFEKFTHGDHARQGMGIGLYLARGIAHAHQGELTCRRAATGGACFQLSLPRPDH